MSRNPKFPSDPKIWGPGTWWVLHTLSFDVFEDQADLNYFIKSLIRLCHGLPCSKCRNHAIQFLEHNPPNVKITIDGNSAFKYTFELHNYVNRINGKKELDYATAFEIYKKNVQTTELTGLCPDGTSSCLSINPDKKVKMKFL